MAKSQTVWSNATKNTNQWVKVGRNGSQWQSTATQQVPYLYDSPTITYDNAFTYDYLAPIANQTNNKNASMWSNT